MPAAPRKAEKNDEKPEPVTPAEAAAAEAVPDEEKDDTILVPFRGVDIPVPNPAKTRDSFAVQMAVASGNDARLLYVLVGARGSRMIEALIDDSKDDFLSVAREFFTAYGEVTGQGNS
jgi:hypothetical protein